MKKEILSNRKRGWCESPTPIPGAVAYTNDELDNGPRSHIGIVSYAVPEVASRVEQNMTAELKQKFRYVPEFGGSGGERLTIYHNAKRTIVGLPQNDNDVKFFTRAKFLVPPESCARRV